jgi:hypothetical protein
MNHIYKLQQWTNEPHHVHWYEASEAYMNNLILNCLLMGMQSEAFHGHPGSIENGILSGWNEVHSLHMCHPEFKILGWPNLNFGGEFSWFIGEIGWIRPDCKIQTRSNLSNLLTFVSLLPCPPTVVSPKNVFASVFQSYVMNHIMYIDVKHHKLTVYEHPTIYTDSELPTRANAKRILPWSSRNHQKWDLVRLESSRWDVPQSWLSRNDIVFNKSPCFSYM